MKNPDIIDSIRPVVRAFEKLGILYYIGGSIASSAYDRQRGAKNAGQTYLGNYWKDPADRKKIIMRQYTQTIQQILSILSKSIEVSY